MLLGTVELLYVQPSTHHFTSGGSPHLQIKTATTEPNRAQPSPAVTHSQDPAETSPCDWAHDKP
jgi:hypothetical protein